MAPHPELAADSPAQGRPSLASRALHLAHALAKRDDPYKNLASAGSRPATDLAGPGFQVLFALIGVGMTITAIWFFFWARNGGFRWRQDDWEDYKSTVLRRKGPDGRTLSNATKSTRLGGGSVVHGGSYGAPTSVGYTDETATSADMSEMRDAEEGKSRHGLRGGDGRRKKKHRRDRTNEHTNDYNDPDLDGYRHEKAARVGGLNRQADGMYTDYSPTEPSDLGSNVSARPLVNKDKRDPKKEAKEKERRARERMKNAKAAEKEAQKAAAAREKARKEADKAEAKRDKAEQKKAKKTRSEAGSDMPEMVETRTEYTRAFTEYTAPSEYDHSEARDFAAPPPAKSPVKSSSPAKSSSQAKSSTPAKPAKPAKAPSNARRAPPSAAYSFTTGDDDANTVYTGAYTEATDDRTAAESSYYSDYRPRAERSQARHQSRDRASHSRPRPAGSRSRPSSQSPQKRHRSSQPTNSQAPSDIFTATNGGTQGHMSYPCYIPGLSQAGSVGVSESVSQVGGPSSHRRDRDRGGRDVMAGYRRGGGRRDSLSDSDS